METKKLFSIAVVTSIAVAAFGQTDITPAGLKWATANSLATLDYAIKTSTGGNINSGSVEYTDGYKNNPNQRLFYFGTGANGVFTEVGQIVNCSSILDMGGNVGKVMRLDGSQSGSWASDFWATFGIFSNPELTPYLSNENPTEEQKREATTRVKVVFSCDFNRTWVEEASSRNLLSIGVNTFQNDVKGVLTRMITTSDFIKSEYDEEADDVIKKYDPEAWFEVTWDITPADKTRVPLWIKFNIQAGLIRTFKLNLKEVSFLAAPNDARLTDGGTPILTKLTIPTSINNPSVAKENALKVVAESGAIRVYDVPVGELISVRQIGGGDLKSVPSTGDLTTISLSKGSYIVVASGKVAKVLL